MLELTRSGAAVVFVSHNLNYIQRLCDTALYLKKGREHAYGPAQEVVSLYTREHSPSAAGFGIMPGTDEYFVVRGVTLLDPQGRPSGQHVSGDPMTIRMEFEAMQYLKSPHFTFYASDNETTAVVAHFQQKRDAGRPSFAPGVHVIEVDVESNSLLGGIYNFRLGVCAENLIAVFGKVWNLAQIEVIPRADQYPAMAPSVELSTNWRVSEQIGTIDSPESPLITDLSADNLKGGVPK